MTRRGIQSESESEGWICNNPACLRYFPNIGRWTRHLTLSVVECNNGVYNRVRLSVYLRELAKQGATAAGAIRAARIQEEAEQLQRAHETPAQRYPILPSATHASSQPLIASLPTINIPVEPIYYDGIRLYDTPLRDTPLQNISTNDTVNDIPLDIPSNTTHFNHERLGDMNHVWTNQNVYPADGEIQQPYVDPSTGNWHTANANLYEHNIWQDMRAMDLRGGVWNNNVDPATWPYPDETGMNMNQAENGGLGDVGGWAGMEVDNYFGNPFEDMDGSQIAMNSNNHYQYSRDDGHVMELSLDVDQPSPEIDHPIETEASRLFNPFDDDAEPAYLRIETPNGVTYKHASAGSAILEAGQSKTFWQSMREENFEKYDGCPWGRWGTKLEWEDAYWMVNSKSSQTALDELLKTERYVSNPPKFKSVKSLFDTIDNELHAFAGPEWKHMDISLTEAPGDRSVFYYRDLGKVGDYLFGTPRFAGKMALGPEVHLNEAGIREYSQVNTGDHWNLHQRNLRPGTTYGAAVLMSDATVLSQFTGDTQAHGVYMSLANIDKDVRASIGNGAWLLVGIIPKSTWSNSLAGVLPLTYRTTLMHTLNRRLFHRCMEELTKPFQTTEPHDVLDPEGIMRSIQYGLSIYGADLEEQCHIAGTAPNACPQCIAQGHQLGDPMCQCVRSSASIMQDIKTVLRDFNLVHGRNPDVGEFLEEGKRYGLNGVHKPFWRRLPNFDICKALSPDMLHGVHKMTFDHPHKWNSNGLGPEELDARLMAQIPVPGERMFPQGVSKLQQLSGKDHRALERVHVPIVAHAPTVAEGGGGSDKLTKATRGIMDCVFLAQYPVHTEQTIAAFEESYRVFHANKDVWIENESKRNKKSKKSRKKNKDGTTKDNVIRHWAIPKIHILRHIPEHVRLKGTMDNYNTETMEHLHRPMLKDPYRGTNRRGWKDQIVRRLKLSEAMCNYADFMDWNNAQTDKGKSGSHTNERSNATDNESDEEDQVEVEREQGRVKGQGDGNQNEGEEVPEERQLPEPPELAQQNSAMTSWNGYNAYTDQYHSANNAGRDGDEERDPVLNFPTTSSPRYLVAKRPASKGVVIGTLMQKLDLPKFVRHLQDHPYFSSLPVVTTEANCIQIWTSLPIKIPPSSLFPKETLARVISRSGYEEKQRCDSVFYVPTNRPGVRVPECERIHDYAVGRVMLLFSLAPSLRIPQPRLMAYIQRFSSISKTPSSVSGLHAVKKLMTRNIPRYEVIAASQIARPCPLAPCIKGPANPDIVGSNSFAYYDTFYVNKYRTPRDFIFIHST